jgi:hypothetical protein
MPKHRLTLGAERRKNQGCARRGEAMLMGHSVTPPRRLAHRSPGVCVLLMFLCVPAVVRGQPMRWPDAVAVLAAERTRAETCVQLLKRHAGHDAAALSRGQLAYNEAKAAVDAVIAGLIVVLAEGGTPPLLADLEAWLTRGVQAREDFCRKVIALTPEDPGTHNPLVALLGAVLPPLLEAARTLYTSQTAQDRLRRQTIQTQLEATTWAPFADLTP